MTEESQFIEGLLSQMTLEEKVSLCHAATKFTVAAIERLNIPTLTMSDGPHGVRREICRDSWDFVETETDYATNLPAGVALASTWNPAMARKYGEVLGAEARERGKDIILGPGINIMRTPLCGRNWEYYSEDPCLIAELVAPEVEGVQSQDVAACVKHYAANSQEMNRNGVDVQMDERTLREIYLPGYEAAVVKGKALSFMGAYNKFHGQHCCHNAHLVNDILKGEWGFEGCYISDWAGVHDTTEAAQNGMDIEMGTSSSYEDYYLARPFLEAIRRGELDEALATDKARRVLRLMWRSGMFRKDRKPGERNTRRHQQAALEIAREGIVLLKNEGALLPLDAASLRRLVVIGDNATEKHALGGASAAVKALYEVSPLEGLRAKLGSNVEIQHFRGYPSQENASEPIKAEYLGTADEGAGTHGWKAFFYTDREGCWMRSPADHTRADADIDFNWSGGAPFPSLRGTDYSVRWETTLTVPQAGAYTFVLEGTHHASLELDGRSLILRWENDNGSDILERTVELEPGKTYHLAVALKPASEQVRVKLGWIPPWVERKQGGDTAAIIAAAKAADAVLFFGGLNHQYDSEGSDRVDMALHDGQNELLAAVLAANPKTAVILVSGSPVEMPWADQASAIVEMWYAGMESGNAIADVLLGAVNPSGKLPVTFPKRLADSPAHALDDYHFEACRYKEGVLVGYRWADAKGIEPLFPFGHGLSYTTFELSNLRAEKTGDSVRVTVQLTNTGARAGAEVVQLYVGQRQCALERPLRELKAFRKVFLQPGQSETVDMTLDRRAFAYWNPATQGWTVDAGVFTLEAGVSSRDLRCKVEIVDPYR